jgi:hypothetical protein
MAVGPGASRYLFSMHASFLQAKRMSRGIDILKDLGEKRQEAGSVLGLGHYPEARENG